MKTTTAKIAVAIMKIQFGPSILVIVAHCPSVRRLVRSNASVAAPGPDSTDAGCQDNAQQVDCSTAPGQGLHRNQLWRP